jgi:hypothetical protein
MVREDTSSALVMRGVIAGGGQGQRVGAAHHDQRLSRLLNGPSERLKLGANFVRARLFRSFLVPCIIR